jgi:ATP-dependent DNA ligase
MISAVGISTSARHSVVYPPNASCSTAELVVLDEDGRSNIAKLARDRAGTHYYAFDLLQLGDADLRQRPPRRENL